MKTKFLFVTALTTLMCTSCQEEASDCTIQPGLDTYAGMTISIPKELVESRATADGTTEESTINSVKIGTWSDGNNTITYTTLVGTDFTHDGKGNYTAIKAIKAKTGKTNFIVIANSKEELTIAQVNGATLNKTVADIATDSFVMYSREVKVLPDVQPATKEQVERATTAANPLYTTNRTSVTLRRAAAKVTVTSSLATTTGVLDATGLGKLYNITWTIANRNSQMTAITNKLNTAGDFIVKNIKSPFLRLDNETPNLIVPKTGDAASYAYCLENSNGQDVYKENNTTVVHVTATFGMVAGKYVNDIEGTLSAPLITLGAGDMRAGRSYCILKKEFVGLPVGTFLVNEAYEALEGLLGREMTDDECIKYTRGIGHWVVYIHDGSAMPNYGVLRNHIYEMNIKSIKGPGLPEFPDTDKPISTNADIQVDLKIRDWTDWDMGEIEF